MAESAGVRRRCLGRQDALTFAGLGDVVAERLPWKRRADRVSRETAPSCVVRSFWPRGTRAARCRDSLRPFLRAGNVCLLRPVAGRNGGDSYGYWGCAS